MVYQKCGKQTENIGGGKCVLVKGWMLDFIQLKLNHDLNHNFVTESHGDSKFFQVKEKEKPKMRDCGHNEEM